MFNTGYRLWAMGNRLLIIASCLLFTGCASTKGHPFLTPLPTTIPGYTVSGQNAAFSNDAIKVSISPLNSSKIKKLLAEKDANSPLIEALTQPGYLLFLLDIENSSKAKVMYNPSFTTLFDNNMGLHKPLDYTDLYALIDNLPNPEMTINKVKDIIYDLASILTPGQRTSRILIFSGIDSDASEATITMKEVYIGMSTIMVSFGFKITEEPREITK